MDNEKFAQNPEKEASASVPEPGQVALDEAAGDTASLPVEASATPEEVEQLRAEAAKAKENWDKLLRTAADFENYKKRAARERQELTKYANESLLQRLLPVMDAFEGALANTGTPAATTESVQTGIKMIQQQLKAALAEAGLEEIDALNKPFDPNWHEALSQQESADVPEGQVLHQLRKGYKLKEKLLRPASVVVSKPPSGKNQG